MNGLRTRTKVAIAVVGVAAAAFGTSTVLAVETATSEIAGSALSAVTSGATLAATTLNGGNQTSTATASTWTLKDPRGTGASWSLTATATAPTSPAGSVETVARVLTIGALSITAGTIAAGVGADAVGTLAGATVAPTGSAVTVVLSNGTNKGTYTLTPEYSLAIPANAFRSNYAGAVGSTALNPYSVTITYTMV